MKTVLFYVSKNETPPLYKETFREKLLLYFLTRAVHFSKRTSKIFGMINKVAPFVHNGVEYFVDSYFYRVEFQVC